MLRTNLLASLLLLATLAGAPASAGVSECSTPDPRNAYDYCIVVDDYDATVLRATTSINTATPFCFPVPVLGSVCPTLVEVDGTGVNFVAIPATLTILSGATEAHNEYLLAAVCDLLPPTAICNAINLQDLGAATSLPLALADINADGTPDGVAVRSGTCVQISGSHCYAISYVWYYLGR
jgi:hypothetical protein